MSSSRPMSHYRWGHAVRVGDLQLAVDSWADALADDPDVYLISGITGARLNLHVSWAGVDLSAKDLNPIPPDAPIQELTRPIRVIDEA
jgi:hypothetical protein